MTFFHSLRLSIYMIIQNKVIIRLLLTGLIIGQKPMVSGQNLSTLQKNKQTFSTLLDLIASEDEQIIWQYCRAQLEADPDLFPCYNHLIQTGRTLNKLDSCRIIFTQLKVNYPRHPFIYYGWGLLEEESGNIDVAMRYYGEACELKSDFYLAYKKLADLARETGDADSIITALRKKKYTDLDIAHTFLGLGVLYNEIREYDSARVALENVIKRQADSWEAYYELADVYYNMSDYNTCLSLLAEAYRGSRQYPYYELEGRILGLKGLALWNIDQYDNALDAFQEAISIFKQQDQQRYVGLYLGNTGLIYMYTWQYPQALDIFHQALDIHRKTGFQVAEAMTLNNIGLVYLNSSHYSRALEYFRSANSIFEETNYLRGTAIIQANLGATYNELGEYDRALDHYLNALQIRRKAIPNKRDEGILLSNLGYLYHKLNDTKTAARILRQALTSHYETGQLSYQGYTLNMLGNVALGQSQPDSARLFFQRALDIGRTRAIPQLEWDALFGLAKTCVYENDREGAKDYFFQSIRALESNWRSLELDELKEPYLGPRNAVYHQLLALLYQEYQINPKAELAAQSFHLAERTKARAFLDLLATANLTITSGIDSDLLQRESALQRTLDSLQTARMEAFADPDSRRLKTLNRLWDQKRKQQENLTRLMKQRHRRYGELKYPEPLTLGQVRDRILDDNTVLLEYLVDDSVSYLWAVTTQSVLWVRVPGEKDLRDRIRVLIQSLKQPRLEKFSSRIGYALYQDLIASARPFIKSDCRVIISPDGVLHYLPFELLNTVPGDSTHFLVNDIATQYTPSASVLAHRYHPDPTRWSRDWLGMGDPLYTLQESMALYITGDGQLMTGPFPDTTLSIFTVNRLPFSEHEITRIAEQFPRGRTEVRLRQEATEAALKTELDLSQYKFLHLAGHGLILENQPSYSGLLLTIDSSAKEDGLLQMREIFNLDLNADLVVLSACQTGLGQLVRGEGMVGLSRAFMYAGAASLVVSLWPVSDESTTLFMTQFYANLLQDGASKAEALRHTKRSFLQHPLYSSPYYWAPFILIGDGNRPMEGNR